MSPVDPLIVAPDESTLWAWFPHPGSKQLEIRKSDDEDGVWIATGEPTPGVGRATVDQLIGQQAELFVLSGRGGFSAADRSPLAQPSLGFDEARQQTELPARPVLAVNAVAGVEHTRGSWALHGGLD